MLGIVPQCREVEVVNVHDAVRPGTSLPDYARDLARMHHDMIGGSRPALLPRALVARSWERVLGLGPHW